MIRTAAGTTLGLLCFTLFPASGTQVILLGTGNPNPVPERSGPATATVVNG